ncbi:MAG: TMEM165/GDT1 family protein [Qipengyuania sp.]
MTASLFLALAAVLLTGLGGRDQLLVARLSHRLGARPLLLGVGVAVSAISAAGMAWAGALIGGQLSDSAETMLVAIALLLAALELLWPQRDKPLREPTRSLGAAVIVLLARQFCDGPRLLIFAIAAAMGSPALAAIGGAIGGAAALALGWTMGEGLEQLPLRTLRLVLASTITLMGVIIALGVWGLL